MGNETAEKKPGVGCAIAIAITMGKGVGESIYSGFTHNPHHLILDSVLWVFTRLVCN